MARLLAAEGLQVRATIRDHTVNDVDVIMRPRDLPGLFAVLQVSASVDGESVAPYLFVSIVPGACSLAGMSVGGFVPPEDYAATSDPRDRGPRIRTADEARDFEQRLSSAVPRLEARLTRGEGRAFLEETNAARAAAERYLRSLQPGQDLQETLSRLRRRSGDDEWNLARTFARYCVRSVGLSEDRLVFDIAALCHVLFAEDAARPFPDFAGFRGRKSATPPQLELIRRVDLTASRLAREPGWPEDDPLVPRRPDPDAPITPLESPESQSVADLFDAYVASRNLTCGCGRPLAYVSHTIDRTDDPPSLLVTARCTQSHVETVEVVWQA
jgi:hypothetical protein